MPRRIVAPTEPDPEIRRLQRDLDELILERKRFDSYADAHSEVFQTHAHEVMDAKIAAKRAELDQLRASQPKP